jgi:hypothetical protein
MAVAHNDIAPTSDACPGPESFDHAIQRMLADRLRQGLPARITDAAALSLVAAALALEAKG